MAQCKGESGDNYGLNEHSINPSTEEDNKN